MINAKVRVIKMLILETGTYNTQYRRPYNTNFNGQIVNQLNERMGGGKHFNPPMLSGLAGQILTPSSIPEDPNGIQIPEGWNNRRLRFMMEVETTGGTMGEKLTAVLLGYSDYVGITHSGAIDPQMQFYINSVIQMKSVSDFTPNGHATRSMIRDNSHLLVNDNFNGVYDAVSIQHKLRPQDVFAKIQVMDLEHKDGGTVLDSRTLATTMASKSSRLNTSPANYLSTVLQSYKQVCDQSALGQSAYDMYSTAMGYCQDNAVTSDIFLMAVSNINGMPISNRFTFGDLRALDPAIDHVTKAIFLSPAEKAVTHNAGSTMEWGGADLTTVVASRLSQEIPGLIMAHGLVKLVFSATNLDYNGQGNLMISDVNGFASGDFSSVLEVLKVRIITEVLNDISANNQMGYNIQMSVDLMGETWIRISLDGGPFIDYVAPSFADALTVPVMTTNGELASYIANDINNLINETGMYNTDYSNNGLSGSFGGGYSF